MISYNRPLYLDNTIRSLLDFGCGGDVLVCDNGSDRQPAIDYLETLARSGARVLRRETRRAEGHRGGLSDAMNEVVDLAIQEDYDLVSFIQDDMQFLWRDPHLTARLMTVFRRHDDALQVSNMFQKKLMKYSLIEDDRIEWHPESASYHLRPYGVNDVGFFHVGRLKEAGFRFLESEGESGEYWRARGHRLYVLHASSLMYVPWPLDNVRRGLHRAAFPPPRRYYLRPLDDAQVQRLLARPADELAFLDDYSRPWGWRCVWPYWYSSFMLRRDLAPYARLVASFWCHGEILVPRIVCAV